MGNKLQNNNELTFGYNLSSLKNEIVYHGIYGKGIIEEVGENTLDVFFDNIDKSCKFSYPSCFRKFLVAQNNAVKEMIEADVNNWLVESGTLKKEETVQKTIKRQEGIKQREKERKIARIKKAQAEAQRSRFFASNNKDENKKESE